MADRRDTTRVRASRRLSRNRVAVGDSMDNSEHRYPTRSRRCANSATLNYVASKRHSLSTPGNTGSHLPENKRAKKGSRHRGQKMALKKTDSSKQSTSKTRASHPSECQSTRKSCKSSIVKERCNLNYSQPSTSKEVCVVNNELAGMNKEIEKDEKISSMAAYLPEEVLKAIYGFLAFEDMVNVKNVCTRWEDAAADTLLWRHAPLKLQRHHAGVYICHVPYLHTVTGSINDGNEMLGALVDYVYDLRKMDCRIYGALSTKNFQSFIKRFKNLEYIRIDNTVPAIVESLDMLSTCTNLKAINLCLFSRTESFTQTCKAIGDGFSSLNKLYVNFVLQGEDYSGEISEMLGKKIGQLTELSLSDSDVNLNILEGIFQSTRLKKFEISISSWPKIPLKLNNMTTLKSLSIQVEHGCRVPENCSADVYREIIFPQNLESFTFRFSSYPKYSTGIIGNVINAAPNLKVLNAAKIYDRDLDTQLMKINTLHSLHTVSLIGCCLSSVGLGHIAQCPKLRKLEVGMTFDDSTFEYLKDCKYLGDLTLTVCSLNSEKFLTTILAMKYLSNIGMHGCMWTDYIHDFEKRMRIIIEKCVEENHIVQISYCRKFILL